MLADAKCDVSMQDCNGATAADLAEKAKEADILKFLKVNRSLTRHGFEFRSSKFRTLNVDLFTITSSIQIRRSAKFRIVSGFVSLTGDEE